MSRVKMSKENLYKLAKKYFPITLPALEEMEYKRYKGTSRLYFVDEDGHFCKVTFDSAPAYDKNLWIYCKDLNIDKVIKLQDEDFKCLEENEDVIITKTTVIIINENSECIGYYEDSLKENKKIQELLKEKIVIRKSERVVKDVRHILIAVQSKIQKEGEKSYEQSCFSGTPYERSRSEIFAG